jgi:hypothetical protein
MTDIKPCSLNASHQEISALPMFEYKSSCLESDAQENSLGRCQTVAGEKTNEITETKN